MAVMVAIPIRVCILSVTLLFGCGPSVGEVRVANYPPREPNCGLEFVTVDMKELSDNKGPWELIGHVVLSQEGKQDPFAEEYKAIVRPRACAMGGEAVAIVMNATAEGAMSSGTTISYGVLRKRTAKSAKPAKF
jgi:hypothetical protein